MKKEHVIAAFPENQWKHARDEFSEFYNGNLLTLNKALDAFSGLAKLLTVDKIYPSPKVMERLKGHDECVKKFELKYLKVAEEKGQKYSIQSEITDLLGVRIVCIYESDIEKVAAVIREALDVFHETDKTEALEIHENQFGYKGLHLDTRLDTSRAALPEYSSFAAFKFEIQIRSIVQDAWSEVDHRLKYKKRIPKDLKRRINRLAALFELADQEFEAIRNNTVDLEIEAEKESKIKDSDQPLSPFNFGPVVRPFFKDYLFEPYKIDGFVDEILQQHESMTVKELSGAISKHIEEVKKFKGYLSNLGHDMNPFTQIRHCLYLENKVLYLNLMRVGPMKNFDRWLEYGTVHPSEIG